ncbi:MAG: helix-turn-helix transcriptional regulator [Candidatus Devosia phytovorans]|uniref:Helix-turn-helix transcriptional regulator n=1 Tax=Candidatus Devosia phytovorans TaxID=3121372 RepID=A0AAJ6B0R3_9HYPH|nr:helix-turn-helix transcriptional regulator [Devosia sp.]WEK05482.1 MAG: helix-turn-helix transcriptional regulator [Devosia sp.]
MLELVRGLVDGAQRPSSRGAAEDALATICDHYGFTSAVAFEYGPGLSTISDLIDSDPDRRTRWPSVLDRHVVGRCVALTRALAQMSAVSRFDATHFGDDKICLEIAAEFDLLEGVVVPILQRSGLSGVVKFGGAPTLRHTELASLHTAAYLMFTALQSTRKAQKGEAHLTPREMQVMEKAALGHTTTEIAAMLGMSERTVNQHTDNVAAKFGTRNRVHTVANLVRLNLL